MLRADVMALSLEDTMHDRDILAWDLVHRDVSGLVSCMRWIRKEKKVATVE